MADEGSGEGSGEDKGSGEGKGSGTPGGASAGQNVTVETPTPTPPAEGTWFGDFSDDNKTFLTAKGWDKEGSTSEAVLTSYRALEKMRGVPEDKLLVIPDFSDADSSKAFFAKLGVPDKPEGYNTPARDIVGEALGIPEIEAMSHGMNHTPAQHEQFVNVVSEFFEGALQLSATTTADRDSLQKQELDRSWGSLKDENYAAAAKAAVRFGISSEDMDRIQTGGLGYRSTVELFTQIGRAFGEGKSPTPEGSNGEAFGVTPEVAKGRLDDLTKDAAFRQKLFDGDTNAREEWDRLKKLAFRG